MTREIITGPGMTRTRYNLGAQMERKFLGYGKGLHLYNAPISRLIWRILDDGYWKGRTVRMWAAQDGLALIWRDRCGRTRAAFERWGRDGKPYTVVYCASAPADNWANGPSFCAAGYPAEPEQDADAEIAAHERAGFDIAVSKSEAGAYGQGV